MVIQRAGGGGTRAGAASSLEHCAETLGTIAIDDGRRADWYGPFGSATQMTSIAPLLRLAVRQSNCFVITSIGNLRTDSRLSRITDIQLNSGEYRAGLKQQKGQRVAADYHLEPRIVINDSPLGKIDAALGRLVNRTAGVAGGFQDTRGQGHGGGICRRLQQNGHRLAQLHRTGCEGWAWAGGTVQG